MNNNIVDFETLKKKLSAALDVTDVTMAKAYLSLLNKDREDFDEFAQKIYSMLTSNIKHFIDVNDKCQLNTIDNLYDADPVQESEFIKKQLELIDQMTRTYISMNDEYVEKMIKVIEEYDDSFEKLSREAGKDILR